MTNSQLHIIRGLHNCHREHQNAVLTIGNFDGLHLGHQKILEQLHSEASRLNTHSCLMTFEPLPREYFSSDKPSARLMNRYEKICVLNKFKPSIRPDFLMLLNFNKSLAKMTAVQFIENILLEKLKIKSIIIGDDFHFGCDRQGDFSLLQKYGKKYGFFVTSIASHCIDNQRVSSSLIREALVTNELSKANNMLGRHYKIYGHVSHGDKRGRTIGFPTANIHLGRAETALHGVYSVTMHSQNRGDAYGVANIGRRPTVNGERVQLEVHLFDFNEDLYGEPVSVSFQHKIRDEKKFESFNELKQQIQIDSDKARQLLINTQSTAINNDLE